MRITRNILILALCLIFTLALGCSGAKDSLIPNSVVRIGVAGFTQPRTSADLLAGYVSENLDRIETKVFPQLDKDFALMLGKASTRKFEGYEKAFACTSKRPKAASAAAFTYWIQIGQCMNVDVLIVPQVHLWQERIGSDFGVERPAAVIMDIYLLDIQNKTFIARSRYDELQRPLLDNLLDLDKFIERGGKWVTAKQLGQEGMYKAIKEFGL